MKNTPPTLSDFFKPMRLAGRCANGAERDKGTRFHAMRTEDCEYSLHDALCGAAPGKLSAGWVSPNGEAEITCTKCLSKLKKLGIEMRFKGLID